MRALLFCLLLIADASKPSAEQRIRRALLAGTGLVELPAGVIEVYTELEIPPNAHDLEIRGAPSGTTLHAADRFRGRAIFTVLAGSNIRFHDFTIDGNRDVVARPSGLPGSDVPFARFTPDNGLLLEKVTGLNVSKVTFSNVAGFPILVSASSKVRIEEVTIENSGSHNPAKTNNTTGGILLEEGTADFEVLRCELKSVRGNGIWTHSLYTSPRNARGTIAQNRFVLIGRDAIQVGHATRVRVDRNEGTQIGFPAEEVDIKGLGFPVAIDTAGNTDQSAYTGNHFEEINGKCMDLDGFHDGQIRGNTCVNRQPPNKYPTGHYGIVMNNSNPDMQSRNIEISGNTIDGALYGGIFVIGTGHKVTHNRLLHLNMAHCNEEAAIFGCYYAQGQPDMLRSGIYLGRGAERPDAARDNTIEDNEISGFQMSARCIGTAPGVAREKNRIARNECSDDVVALAAAGKVMWDRRSPLVVCLWGERNAIRRPI